MSEMELEKAAEELHQKIIQEFTIEEHIELLLSLRHLANNTLSNMVAGTQLEQERNAMQLELFANLKAKLS